MDGQKLGKVMFVAGLYCAGKTTLTRESLLRIPDLSYIPTYTTREPRPSEKANGTHEYIFVNEAEYGRLRQTPGWDHTELRGVSYGSDAAKVSIGAKNGHSYIVVTTMYPEQIREMRSKYEGETILLFLNTDFDICQNRIMLPDSGRSKKYMLEPTQTPEQAALIRGFADRVYDPLGPLEEDKLAFTAFIREVLDD